MNLELHLEWIFRIFGTFEGAVLHAPIWYRGMRIVLPKIRAAASDVKLSDAEIERLLQRVIREARRRSGIDTVDAEGLRGAAAELGERERIAALVEKRNAALNLAARIGRRRRIVAAAPDLAAGIRAEIHGVNTPISGGRFSAEAEWKALSNRYRGGIVTTLDCEGLLRRGRASSSVAGCASYSNCRRKGRRARRVGIAGARGVSEIIHQSQDEAKSNLNKAGAWIGDYSGYITRTTHDPDKIRRAGFDAWKDSLRGKLDERTFDPVSDNPAARERFLNNIWRALVTGVHLTHDGMQGFKGPAFTGPGNLAERLSAERVLHFRDADMWLDYHQQLGHANVLASVMDALDRAARATALMRRWCTNPRAEFASDLRYLAETWRDRNPEAVIRLRQAEKDLQNRFDFLDGTANIPVNYLGASIGSAMRRSWVR